MPVNIRDVCGNDYTWLVNYSPHFEGSAGMGAG